MWLQVDVQRLTPGNLKRIFTLRSGSMLHFFSCCGYEYQFWKLSFNNYLLIWILKTNFANHKSNKTSCIVSNRSRRIVTNRKKMFDRFLLLYLNFYNLKLTWIKSNLNLISNWRIWQGDDIFYNILNLSLKNPGLAFEQLQRSSHAILQIPCNNVREEDKKGREWRRGKDLNASSRL